MKHQLKDARATDELARRVAASLPDDIRGWTLLLEGELGTGKSTFARALIRALGHSGPVPSPTYTLVEPYLLARGPVYHVDLYRVVDEEELHYLGWTELDEGMRLVEWAERAPGLAATSDLVLSLRYDDEARTAELRGTSPRGADVVARLARNPNT